MAVIDKAVYADGSQIMTISSNVEVFEPEEVLVVEELWNEYLTKGPEKSGYDFIVLREDGKVCGFACFGPRAMTEGTYDLYWIAIDKCLHGHGMGKALICQVEDEIRRTGGRLVVAETSGQEQYLPTRKFYLSAGYQNEAILRDFYKPGDDLVIYTKRL